MKTMRYALLAPLLAAILFGLATGCRNFNLFPGDRDKPTDGPGRDYGDAPGAEKPGRYSVRIAPYVFLSDVELKREEEVFKELAGLRDQVYKELSLPSAERPVYVYLFEDRQRYERYMHAQYPDLPKRRAFFIIPESSPRLGGDRLTVFTFLGDRVRQDLRHELTHALLHSVLKDVPLWLDEGLAEYFEVPPVRHGINDVHLDNIRRSTVDVFRPDLARLEGLIKVEQMTPVEYRESWAWVHLMLRGKPEARAALLAYLQQLRITDKPGPLRPRLTPVLPNPEEALLSHVGQLTPLPVPAPTVRRP